MNVVYIVLSCVLLSCPVFADSFDFPELHPSASDRDRFLYSYENGWKTIARLHVSSYFINGQQHDDRFTHVETYVGDKWGQTAETYRNDKHFSYPLNYYTFNPDKYFGGDYVLERFIDSSELLRKLFQANPHDALLLSAIRTVSERPTLAAHNSIIEEKSKLHALIDTTLGYPPGTLQSYRELDEFVEANNIAQLAQLYGQKFGTDKDGPLLPYNGELHHWRDVLAVVDPNHAYGKAMQDYVYTLHGIEKGSYDSDIRLIKKGGEATYGNRYIIEVLSYPMPSDTARSWIRLYSPNGDVYSVGWALVPAHPNTFSEGPTPMMVKMISPAPEEQHIPKERLASATSTPLEITAKQMDTLLQSLRDLQARLRELPQDGFIPERNGDLWQFVSEALLAAGIPPVFVEKYGADHGQPFEQLRTWREEQVKALQAAGASAEEIERARFALPTDFLIERP